MSLYLIGKTSDNSVAFASDGRGLDRINSVLTDERPKFHRVSDNLVYAGSGSGTTDEIMGRFLALVYSMTQTMGKSIADSVILPDQDMTHLRSIIGKLRAQCLEKGHPLENIEDYSAHAVAYQYEPLVARFDINLAKNTFGYVKVDPKMEIPYRIGGIFLDALVTLAEDALARRFMPRDEASTLGLFSYILTDISKKEDAVGGKLFYGLIDRRGFREINGQDILDIDMSAESVREEIQNRNLAPWHVIENQLKNLGLMSEVNRDSALARRLSISRIKEFRRTGLEEYLDTAKSIAFSGLLDSMNANYAAGKYYQARGASMPAKMAFERVIDDSIDEELVKFEVEALLMATKELIPWERTKYTNIFENAASQAEDSGAMSRAEIMRIVNDRS